VTGHSLKSYRTILSCGAVYYVVFWWILTFEAVDEILKCAHHNERYQAVLFFGVVCKINVLFGVKGLSLGLGKEVFN